MFDAAACALVHLVVLVDLLLLLPLRNTMWELPLLLLLLLPSHDAMWKPMALLPFLFLLSSLPLRNAQYATACTLLHQGLVVNIWCCHSHFLVVLVAFV
jgi:hypothetical protein